MSKLLINQYYNQLDKVKQYGGSHNETSIRNSFFNLLNEYAHKKNLELIPELATMGTKGKKVRPDGILKNALRLEYGLWESKDEKTNLDDEIEVKIRLGYSLKNILFEDSQTAVLYQNDFEVLRVNMKEPEKLDKILTEFVSFEKSEVREFNAALEHFKQDIPVIIETLRGKIEAANKDNKKYIAARDIFLELCQKEINPDVTADDIREMIIQHILTADIFNVVFDEPHFHRENNIARELERLIDTFFTGASRRNALESINHYYKAINAAAASIADHHEKQKFLKIIYENFYKVYNPKAADRLGVVYTPNEIVTFMLESTNYLLEKHFGKMLSDKNVEILDPATGTGTFITELIDQFIPKKDLAYKYQNEIHCNEVSILPYYIANLNIEYTFKQKMGYYEEFKNICFVDTLDNTDALHYKGKQHDLFGLSSENTERIKRQNSKKISVIIGNPPYNANQQNENENNKNREYPSIDARIKETYIKYSTAQKTKVYDMYARFYRWSMDRVDNNGIIAFITNRSFIDSRTFDGFRKSIQDNFSHCYIID
ncbi:MAG: Eco57I restriction-modification methylase domain-containing protein, partial [Bacteroidia bacterium]